ncbi:MAG: hypothetical protein GEU95_22165, partial [Rhizobiales bacterium]|nr:hypothetical protein [Hyphomicrobiales bacterium]
MAVTMGLSLAHALEFPGKSRLDESTYRAVQAIYYPGFTIGGLIGEFGAMLALIVFLIVTPTSTERFWWIAAALGFLVIGHATYWVVTHPVNAAWLKDTSVRIYFLLTGFTLAQAGYQTRPIPDLEPSEKIRTERIAGRGYTATERLDLPATWDFDASFAFGISLILDGVEATVSR